MSRLGALLCYRRSAPDLYPPKKNKDPKEQRLMREGVINKGGWLSHCAKGSQTRAGGYRAEHLNAPERVTERGGVIALKEGNINEHLNAQERGQKEGWGFKRTKNERAKQKRTSGKASEQKTSEPKASETKTNERESRRTKNERAKQKRTSGKASEQKTSEPKASETKTNERESRRTKNERAQSERNKDERA